MVAARPDSYRAPAADDVWLAPVARAVRRGDDEVQFGLDPERGIVLGGLTETESRWLVSLDRAASTIGLARSGARWGLDPVRVSCLIDLLRTHVLVRSGRRDRERRTGYVVVHGVGPLPTLLRGQLRRCNVHRVEPAYDPATPPDLVVLVAADAVPVGESRSWASSGVMHLPVLVRGDRGVVGPLAGRPQSPCLVCLHLLRRDMDPGWPRLLNQLTPPGHEARGPVSVDPALATTLAGVVATLVQAHLDGIVVPAGVTWETTLPSPTVTTRRWSVHPLCPAHPVGPGQAATGFLRGRPRGRLRGTTTPESTS